MSTDDTIPDRLRDAEAALTAIYDRVLEVERSLIVETARAEAAEQQSAETAHQLAVRDDELTRANGEIGRLSADNARLEAELAHLHEQLTNAHVEIDALHNSRTMRYAAIPRRIYAKLRARRP